jgi:hypothetical protein
MVVLDEWQSLTFVESRLQESGGVPHRLDDRVIGAVQNLGRGRCCLTTRWSDILKHLVPILRAVQ